MKCLITGVESGLGKFLHENIGGFGLTRKNYQELFSQKEKWNFDLIVHSAFNTKKDIDPNNLDSYLSDNVFLTRDLLTLPHRYFVFISTVDLYTQTDQIQTEETTLHWEDFDDLYRLTKFMSETLVRKDKSHSLILRPTTLLGPHIKKNSFMKIVKDTLPVVSVRADSIYNFVRHQDVYDFILRAYEANLTGIYNLASSDNVRLSDVAKHMKKDVQFGKYHYVVGNIANKKAASIFEGFNATALETVNQFLSKDLQ